jgi:hypothetical protein
MGPEGGWQGDPAELADKVQKYKVEPKEPSTGDATQVATTDFTRPQGDSATPGTVLASPGGAAEGAGPSGSVARTGFDPDRLFQPARTEPIVENISVQSSPGSTESDPKTILDEVLPEPQVTGPMTESEFREYLKIKNAQSPQDVNSTEEEEFRYRSVINTIKLRILHAKFAPIDIGPRLEKIFDPSIVAEIALGVSNRAGFAVIDSTTGKDEAQILRRLGDEWYKYSQAQENKLRGQSGSGNTTQGAAAPGAEGQVPTPPKEVDPTEARRQRLEVLETRYIELKQKKDNGTIDDSENKELESLEMVLDEINLHEQVKVYLDKLKALLGEDPVPIDHPEQDKVNLEQERREMQVQRFEARLKTGQGYIDNILLNRPLEQAIPSIDESERELRNYLDQIIIPETRTLWDHHNELGNLQIRDVKDGNWYMIRNAMTYDWQGALAKVGIEFLDPEIGADMQGFDPEGLSFEVISEPSLPDQKGKVLKVNQPAITWEKYSNPLVKEGQVVVGEGPANNPELYERYKAAKRAEVEAAYKRMEGLEESAETETGEFMNLIPQLLVDARLELDEIFNISDHLPEWISSKDKKEFTKACIRALWDTVNADESPVIEFEEKSFPFIQDQEWMNKTKADLESYREESLNNNIEYWENKWNDEKTAILKLDKEERKAQARVPIYSLVAASDHKYTKDTDLQRAFLEEDQSVIKSWAEDDVKETLDYDMGLPLTEELLQTYSEKIVSHFLDKVIPQAWVIGGFSSREPVLVGLAGYCTPEEQQRIIQGVEEYKKQVLEARRFV